MVTVRDFTKFRIPPPLSFELEKISRIFPYPGAENLIHLLVFPTYSPGWPGVLPLGKPMTCALEPEVAVYDADNSGSSTDVTPVKAEKVLKRKEKPARKRKSTQESSKVIEWLEVYNQERKVEEEKRRKTQEQHHQDNLSVLSNLVDVLKAWKK